MSIAHESSIQEQFLTACQTKNHYHIPRLLESKANLDHWLDGENTALHIATMQGYTNITFIKLLILNKADPNIMTKSDWATPVFLAAKAGDEKTMRALIELGGNPNFTTIRRLENSDELLKDRSPIFVAADNGHTDCVRTLIEKGADYNMTSNKETPLDLARRNNHGKVVNILENAPTIRQEALFLEENQAITLVGLSGLRAASIGLEMALINLDFWLETTSALRGSNIKYKGNTLLETIRNVDTLVKNIPPEINIPLAKALRAVQFYHLSYRSQIEFVAPSKLETSEHISLTELKDKNSIIGATLVNKLIKTYISSLNFCFLSAPKENKKIYEDAELPTLSRQ
jgi:hypothetical protein